MSAHGKVAGAELIAHGKVAGAELIAFGKVAEAELIAFGEVAGAELIATNSKSQRIVFGSFPAASTWFRISKKNLPYVIFVLLGNTPKIQGIVLMLILA